MNNAKMTFRFDHPKGKPEKRRETAQEAKIIPLHVEEYQVHEERAERVEYAENKSSVPANRDFIDAQTLNQYTSDFGGWQSSFDAETQRIEQMIRKSGGAVSREPGHTDRREHPLGDEPLRDHRWYEPEEPAPYTRRTGGSWLKVTASVAGAVVTGVAFGFFVLSMFSENGGQNPLKPLDGVVVNQQKDPKAAGAGTTNDGAGGAAAGQGTGTQTSAPVAAASSSTATASVILAAKSYALLQGGVFSTAQSAETAQADFRKKGLNAVSEAGEKYPVYVGVAMNKEEAKGLTAHLQTKDVPVVVKSYEIPGATKIRWNGKQTEVFQNYMSQGDKLVQLILGQTLLHATEAKPTPLDEKALQSIKSAHQAWSGSVSAVSDGLGEAGKTALPKMNSALNTAVNSLDEYKKNPSNAMMWQAQASLMQYIVAEKELLKSITVQ
ncbi:SPOR domain-containing protein [Paenibacillus silviterrae]|uniref:SPOR domain-containing protein n=1 Tax=Paenibacillus silviterrae TaxID=3242194 RepID=UPI002542F8D0|nr:SPOR domain-containing protein [Paenibacillus chinjuensis]